MLQAIVQNHEALSDLRDLFAVERHVQLMMVAHAYLEMQRQEAEAAASEPELYV